MSSIPYTYFYQGQIRKYISQFMRVFTGLQVQYSVSRDGNETNDFRAIPVTYGAPDRVVASVLSNDGDFNVSKLPLISVYLNGLETVPDKTMPKYHVENVPVVDNNGTKSVISRTPPVPYKALMEVSIFATNSGQMMQILEQLMLLFNPKLYIQKSNDMVDFDMITAIKLESISNESPYPIGEGERYQQYGLQFSFDFLLQYPAVSRDSFVETIVAKITDTSDPDDFEVNFTVT